MVSRPPRGLVPALLVGALVIAIYARGLKGAFTGDDRTYFIENDDLPVMGLASAATVFARPTNVWGELLPVRDLAYLLQIEAFGLRPLGFHVVSLALYLATCALAGLLVLRLLEPEGRAGAPEPAPLASALLVTALFAAHPAHVESAAYLSEQKGLLSALFSLAALLAYWRALSRPEGRWGWTLAGAALQALALFSKLPSVVLAALVPVLYLVADPARRPRPGRAAAAWLAINLPLVAWFARATRAGLANWEHNSAFSDVPFLERIPRALKILGALTRTALWPDPLSFGYPFDPSPALDPNLVAGVVTLAACAGLAWAFRRERLVPFAAALYLLWLLPILQLHGTLNNASLFDRYLLMPLLGLGVAVERVSRWLIAERWRSPRAHGALLAGLTLALGARAYAHVPSFADDVAMSRNSYDAFPGWRRPPFDLAYALLEAGRTREARLLLASDRTLDHPPWVQPYFEGWALLADGRPAEAVAPLDLASILAENAGYYPFPRIPLARALIALGRHAEAEWGLRRALSCPIYQPVEAWHARKLLEEAVRAQASPPPPAPAHR